jgi:hypothetical protein
MPACTIGWTKHCQRHPRLRRATNIESPYHAGWKGATPTGCVDANLVALHGLALSGSGAGDGNRKYRSGDDNLLKSESCDLARALRAIIVRKTPSHQPTPASRRQREMHRPGPIAEYSGFDTEVPTRPAQGRMRRRWRTEILRKVMLAANLRHPCGVHKMHILYLHVSEVRSRQGHSQYRQARPIPG